jgi:hypothetical protein
MAASNVGRLAGGDGRRVIAAPFVGIADAGGLALPRAGGRTLAAAGGALAGRDGAVAKASTVERFPTVAGRPLAGELRAAMNIAIRTISSCDKVDERTVPRSVATPSHLGRPD